MNRYQKMNPLVWHRKQLGLALLVLLALVTARPLWRALAAAGDFDTSFSSDGKIESLHAGLGVAKHIAIQHDGKVLGLQSVAHFTGPKFELVRRNLDGELDTTFSGDGVVDNIGSFSNDHLDDAASDLAIQFNGMIIVVGTRRAAADNYLQRLTIRRYLPNGNLDSSFAGNSLLLGAYNTDARSVAIQSNGKILVAGNSNAGSSAGPFIARFNADGSLDTSFGFSGYLIVSDGLGIGEFRKIAVQSDGKILAASFNGLRRYSAAGQLDTAFGVNGIVPEYVNDFELLKDGKMVLVINNYTVQRRLANGLPDNAFSETTLSCPTCGYFTSVAVQANGQVIVGSNSYGASTHLARVNVDGGLDTSFGAGGYSESIYANLITDVALMADQRIVVLGDSSPYFAGSLARHKNDNTDTQTTDISVGPITISPTTVNPGDTVTYTITVKNLSTTKAAHVTMKTNVPSGTSYVGTAVPSGWAVLQQPGVGAMGTVSASAYELAPGATTNMFVLVKVPATAAHGSTVSMSANVSNTITETANLNNYAFKVFTVQ